MKKDYFTAIGSIEERIPGVTMTMVTSNGQRWSSNGEYFERKYSHVIIAETKEEAEEKLHAYYKKKEGYNVLSCEIFDCIE